MIRINLLPREKRGTPGRSKSARAALVAVLILVVGGMGGYWLYVRWETTQLRSDIVAARDDIARNQGIVRSVEQFTRDKKRLQGRLELVQRLAAHQDSPVRLLDGISQALPEGGWLTGIQQTSERLVIEGYASSHYVVAELMLALQRLTPIVNSVELNVSKLELYEAKPVERFEILVVLSK